MSWYWQVGSGQRQVAFFLSASSTFLLLVVSVQNPWFNFWHCSAISLNAEVILQGSESCVLLIALKWIIGGIYNYYIQWFKVVELLQQMLCKPFIIQYLPLCGINFETSLVSNFIREHRSFCLVNTSIAFHCNLSLESSPKYVARQVIFLCNYTFCSNLYPCLNYTNLNGHSRSWVWSFLVNFYWCCYWDLFSCVDAIFSSSTLQVKVIFLFELYHRISSHLADIRYTPVWRMPLIIIKYFNLTYCNV